MLFVFFFFFKQKTAYEMRISDWSSDVCSSDLAAGARAAARGRGSAGGARRARRHGVPSLSHRRHRPGRDRARPGGQPEHGGEGSAKGLSRARRASGAVRCGMTHPAPSRSEEHTSELQSLMRISYAVFCLKKTKETYNLS